ncbi:type II restriction endonuclease subunit M, partial [Aerococcus urinae]|nr:type II restriction endonuclease subunit M [Aerococcus urinae]
EIINFVDEAGEQRSRPQNTEFYFKPCISWSDVSSGTIAFRAYPEGYVFDAAGPSIFPDREEQLTLISFLNSGVASELLTAFSSGLH